LSCLLPISLFHFFSFVWVLPDVIFGVVAVFSPPFLCFLCWRYCFDRAGCVFGPSCGFSSWAPIRRFGFFLFLTAFFFPQSFFAPFLPFLYLTRRLSPLSLVLLVQPLGPLLFDVVPFLFHGCATLFPLSSATSFPVTSFSVAFHAQSFSKLNDNLPQMNRHRTLPPPPSRCYRRSSSLRLGRRLIPFFPG